MSRARRLVPSMPAFRPVLVLVALLGHLLLPLVGTLPAVANDGLPGADLCTTTPQPEASRESPAQPHDPEGCALHCLGHAAANGLPAIAEPAWFPAEYRHARPGAPDVTALPASAATPFAARAPPPQA